MEYIEWVLSEKPDPEKWVLLQREETLVLQKNSITIQEKAKNVNDEIYKPYFQIAEFIASRPIVMVKSNKDKNARAIYLGGLNSIYYQQQNIKELTIETDFESLKILKRKKSDKACLIGRDEYGLYEELNIKGVIQRFRYISPGRFLMGSPPHETQSSSDETQHEVILTKGYWLADTACTQELWKTIMGNNPSRFRDNRDSKIRPVENVSWDMCKEFVKRLNDFKPGFGFRMPTEAEWEYACRGGTTTPFSFGEDITFEQVNYNSEYPYKDGKKVKKRGETVTVKSLPCNNWGLYEMHGNVWEWCEDWFGEFGSTKEVDPCGPGKGEDRFLRGGSWGYDARDVRSACRDRGEPGFRYGSTGLRLARGQKS